MKHTLKTQASIVVCVLVMATAALGQGTANWASLNPSFITAQTNSTQYSPLFFGGGATGFGTQGATAAAGTGGTLYYFSLLYLNSGGVQAAAPTTLAALNAWQDTGLSATNSIIAGRLAPVNPNTAATVPWVNGVTNSIMMVGWSANLGTTWSAASSTLNGWETAFSSLSDNAFFGTSNTGFFTPNGDGVNPGGIIFGGSPNANGNPINSPNMQLYVIAIPEPGTLALAGLGGLALLAFRRNR